MKFTIITPTLQRESLVECCASVDAQTYQDWEQVIAIDLHSPEWHQMRVLTDSRRFYLGMGRRYNNYGNTPRHEAWNIATGDYLVYLDDDNFLADSCVLEDIAEALRDRPDFAIFPILRHGQRFFNDPPGLCMTDTANVVVKRGIGRWPDIQDYTADGIWVEALKAKHTYQAFPDFAPIVIMPKSNEGK